jgi:hypothetical protein
MIGIILRSQIAEGEDQIIFQDNGKFIQKIAIGREALEGEL